MSIVNDNYPNKNSGAELTDDQLKEVALQQFQQAEVKKFNFPTEVISLPSQGKLYPEGHPASSGKIEMKYMTAKEEDILTSQNLLKQGTALETLFQSLIVSPIKYNDLTTGDRNAIMVAARILGYGKDYKCEITCPACNNKTKITVDLTSINEKNIPEDVNLVDVNKFRFMLPASKREVVFKVLTGRDEEKIKFEVDGNKKSSKRDGIDTTLSTRLKHIIISVDGNSDTAYVRNFVDNELFAIDSKALREYMMYVTPDQPLEFNFICSECGHDESKLSIPVTTEFFWPRA